MDKDKITFGSTIIAKMAKITTQRLYAWERSGLMSSIKNDANRRVYSLSDAKLAIFLTSMTRNMRLTFTAVRMIFFMSKIIAEHDGVCTTERQIEIINDISIKLNIFDSNTPRIGRGRGLRKTKIKLSNID
jgi:hypothetical protein